MSLPRRQLLWFGAATIAAIRLAVRGSSLYYPPGASSSRRPGAVRRHPRLIAQKLRRVSASRSMSKSGQRQQHRYWQRRAPMATPSCWSAPTAVIPTVHKNPLRPDQGFCAGDVGRAFAQRAADQPVDSGEQRQGGRLSQGQSRKIITLCRHGQPGASFRRNVRFARRRPCARTVQWIECCNPVNVAGYTDAFAATAPAGADQGRAACTAVTSPARSSVLPEIPTLAEAGLPDQEVEVPQGVFVPAGTPKQIIDYLNRAIGTAMAQPDVKAKLAAIGFEAVVNSPEEFADRIRNEIPKWRKVIKDAGIEVSQ